MKYISLLLINCILAGLLLPGMPVAARKRTSVSIQTGKTTGTAGLFITAKQIAFIKNKIARGSTAHVSAFRQLQRQANAAMRISSRPFYMNNVKRIVFHWCSKDRDGVDNSLKDAVKKFKKQSSVMRTLALYYALTGKMQYAVKALAMMSAWASRQTLVNVYDFHPDFGKATIDGITKGYCSKRPWNFALDTIWQVYGLINVADAYLLIKQNGYDISRKDKSFIRHWIRRVAEAVNSGFHAWTKWGDRHKRSSSYARYRSDNHLSWCLAGLLSAAAALNDKALAMYVLKGTSWKDSRAGLYANPSSVYNVIERAIEPGPGSNQGRIYEEKILRKPPVGYALFHLWGMMLVARMAEIHFNTDIWSYTGRSGAGLHAAFSRYADIILGKKKSPRPQQDRNLEFYAWMYIVANYIWPSKKFAAVARKANPRHYITQSIGPVRLLFGK